MQKINALFSCCRPRPLVCLGFQATIDACGSSQEKALAILSEWEILTDNKEQRDIGL
jgi:hypothetical protein